MGILTLDFLIPITVQRGGGVTPSQCQRILCVLHPPGMQDVDGLGSPQPCAASSGSLQPRPASSGSLQPRAASFGSLQLRLCELRPEPHRRDPRSGSESRRHDWPMSCPLCCEWAHDRTPCRLAVSGHLTMHAWRDNRWCCDSRWSREAGSVTSAWTAYYVP